MCKSLFTREREVRWCVGVAQMFPIFIGNLWTKGGPVVENLTGMVQDEEGNLAKTYLCRKMPGRWAHIG